MTECPDPTGRSSTAPDDHLVLAPAACFLLIGGVTLALGPRDGLVSVLGVAFLLIGVVAVLVACMHGAPDGPRAPRPPLRATFWVLEVAFMAGFIVVDGAYLWEWWSDGERVTAVVVSVVERGEATRDDDDSIIVRHPVTELGFTIDRDGEDVGDRARLVVDPRDPTEGASPEAVRDMLAIWIALGMSAVLWPILFWLWYVPRWHPGPTPPSTLTGEGDFPRPERAGRRARTSSDDRSVGVTHG